MSCVKIVVVSSDNVCLDVKYDASIQDIIQREATHFMFTHNSLVFVVPHAFQSLQSRKITYNVNLTNLSHLIAEKLVLTTHVKEFLTDYVQICMFHMMVNHPGTIVECVNLVDDDE